SGAIRAWGINVVRRLCGMATETSARWRGPALAGIVTAIGVFAVLMLLANIFERKQEARMPLVRVVELDETVDDPAVWGENFPDQYEAYLQTVDMERTRFGGSDAVP